jgi:hypothetical protein
VNVSSLANPITLANIRTVSLKESEKRINKSVQQGLQDSRYPRLPDGRVMYRFSGKEYIGKTNLRNLSEEDATKISIIFDELNDLAKKYDIPQLRGIYSNKRGTAIMSMGDGVLKVNPDRLSFTASQKRFVDGMNRINKTNVSLATYKSWKYGDKSIDWRYKGKKYDRPFGVDDYLDNDLEKLRSTMYHEFGHHVHQMKYVNKDTTNYGNFLFKPKVEEKLLTLTNKKYPSNYSKTNNKEWFAENFSLYEMGKRKDLIDPQFIKLIEELQ